MHIEIIAVGQKMPDWVNRGYADYAGRLSGDLTLGLTEIPLQKRSSASQLAAAQNKEAAQIKSVLQTCDHIVTLDIPGREHSSIGRRSIAASPWSLAARKASRRTSRHSPAKAGRWARSPCRIRWCASSSPKRCTAPGASTTTIPIIVPSCQHIRSRIMNSPN